MDNYFIMLCKLWLQDLKNYLQLLTTYPKKSYSYAMVKLQFWWACLKLEFMLSIVETFKELFGRK